MVPVAASYPPAGAEAFSLLFDPADKFALSGSIAQINRQELESASKKVSVAIYETWQGEPAVEFY
jgi:hypothetical protein